jgi:hypothetical protein
MVEGPAGGRLGVEITEGALQQIIQFGHGSFLLCRALNEFDSISGETKPVQGGAHPWKALEEDGFAQRMQLAGTGALELDFAPVKQIQHGT